MIVATALVLLMTLPGLALLYAGMVRVKNALSVLMQCFAIASLVSVLWVAFGYSLAFTGPGMFVGGLGKAFMAGITATSVVGTIPESVFATFQMTFAIITPALTVGAFAERMKFGACYSSSRSGSHASTCRWPTWYGAAPGRSCGTGVSLISQAARWCMSMPASPDSPRRSSSGAGTVTRQPRRRRTTCRSHWSARRFFGSAGSVQRGQRARGERHRRHGSSRHAGRDGRAALSWMSCRVGAARQAECARRRDRRDRGLVAITPASGTAGPAGAC
jgi:Amt family ammonium transporter